MLKYQNLEKTNSMKHLKKINESDGGLQKVVVYYACFSGGDGSVHLRWYLDQETASDEEYSQDEGWGEDCTGHVETFVGSDIHKKAVENDTRVKNSPERKLIEELKSIPKDEVEIEDWLDKYFKTFDNNKEGVNVIRQRKEDAKDKLIRLCRTLDNGSTWRMTIRNFRF